MYKIKPCCYICVNYVIMSADGLNGRCYISGEECNYDGYCNRFEIYDDLLNIIEEEVEIKELTLKYIVKDDKIKIVGVKE